ncbi:MAG: hypothetical protein ACFFFH_11525 [Candidatus Thorarchaeota archaeon]
MSKTPKQASVWMFFPRLVLAFLSLYLGSSHLLLPEVFRKILELPTYHGILFKDLMMMILTNSDLFSILRIIVALSDILIDLALLIGFLLRLMGLISSILLFFISLSLIPN